MNLVKRKRDYSQYLILILPALIIYTLFHIVPIFQDIGVSMTNSLSIGSPSRFVGLRNFKTLLFTKSYQHDVFIHAFFWTALYWFGNWMLNILLGLGFALIFYEGVKFQKLFLIIIFLPYVTSNLAMGYIVRLMIDPNSGAINWLLLKIGILRNPLRLLKNDWIASLTLILLTGWKFTGFNVALFLGGLILVPVEVLEAAAIDGCSYLQKLFKVMFPQIWPTFIGVSVLCFTGTWQVFALPVALSGTVEGSIKSLDVLAAVFYRWAFGREGFGLASAMMVIVGLFLFLGSLYLQNLIKRKTVEY